ncbi:hypothetical protein BSNK01_08500 [Bacillaceae bacterium]
MQSPTRFFYHVEPVGKKNWKSAFVLAMCGTYIVQFLTQSYPFKLFLSLLSVIVFFFCLTEAKAVPRCFGIAMFVTGLALNGAKGDDWSEVVNGTVHGIIANLPLLTLVILVPLISIPLKLSGYFESIHYYLWRLTVDARKLFGSLSLFLFCLGPILNLGSIRVLHEMVKDLRLSSIVLAKSYLVGFSTVILWSPYFASVALVLYYLDVPVSRYLPYGLTFALIQLAVGNLLFWLWLRRKRNFQLIGGMEDAENGIVASVGKRNPAEKGVREEDEASDATVSRHRKRIAILLLILLVLMGSIFVLEHLTKWPLMFLVSLVSIGLPLLWGGCTGRWSELKESFKDFEANSVPAMNNEIVLFISAGLFGNALADTAVAELIKTYINELAAMSFLLFVLTVFAVIILFTFVGVHQIVVVTALVTQMDAKVIGTSPEVLALMLMTAWSISAVLSPVNPLNLLVSGSVRQPPLAVGLKWNGAYLCSMFVLGTLFIYLIH